jgi:D-alanyl-D-alanine carboxypeptidase/D-alanyl-D-alanine-endopeptidase (penicillin-binding protein 4)
MKKYILLLLSLFLLGGTAVKGQGSSINSSLLPNDSVPALPWPQSLQADIDTLLATSALLDVSEVGLIVYDLSADSALYSYHPRHTLRPASNMKLVTSIAALDRLGGAHKFRTSLYYTGVLDSCTLRGSLYCVGGMDPKFDDDDLQVFAMQVRSLGIDTIRGRIVADKSMKDSDLLGWGWCWDDDNPVLSPLLVSRKDEFTQRFVQQLQRQGIVVDVELAEGRLPNGANLICSSFHTMDQVLLKMMKDSDNLYAESMFYHLALSQMGRPATAKMARDAVNKLIERLGLKPSDYIIADGSGLSLYNYLSPELEVALLRHAWRNSEIREHLYPSLPIAGVDGTLSKRMHKTPAEGNVHAKTGTLKGVTTLAGYCRAANGHILCFSIMNQGVMQLSRGRDFQDRLCVLMCQPR